MNKDERQGKVEKVKGYVKEKAGQATGDRDLEAEGAGQKAAGAIQEKIGQGRSKLGKAIKKLGKSIKG
jgi:uncharacterized protein YjbJ (UPF0337 family)